MMVGDNAASQRDQTSYFRIGSRRGSYPSISRPARLRSATRDARQISQRSSKVRGPCARTSCSYAMRSRLCRSRRKQGDVRHRSKHLPSYAITRRSTAPSRLLDPGSSVYCVWVVSPVNSLRTTPCAVAATVLVPCWMRIRLDEILAHISGGWQAATIFTSSQDMSLAALPKQTFANTFAIVDTNC